MTDHLPPATVIAPAHLVAYLKTLPYLGQATLSHAQVVAGAVEEVELSYLVGSAGLADSGVIKATFRFYSDWALFQTDEPAGRDHLSADYVPRPTFPGESPATVRELRIRFDQKGHERPYQKAVIVEVVDGYLKPGDRIVIRLGDRRYGGPGTRVQTFVEDAFRIRCYVDTAGTSRFAALPDDMALRIVPGPAERLQIITPRLVRVGAPVPIVIRAEDRWGNVAHAPGPAQWRLMNGTTEIERGDVPWQDAGGTARIGVILPQDGLFAVNVSADGDPRLNASAPVTADAVLDVPRALFADLHIHAHDTVGTNSTESNLQHGRDAGGLDIFGYTVNDFQITDRDWASALAACRAFHQDGSFVVFPGTEWCGASAVGGDHNVVFLGGDVRFPLGADGQSVRAFAWHEHLTSARPVPGRWPLTELYEAYADQPEQVLMIPHVGGRRAILDWHHAHLERLIEITSSWGHFAWFYQEALARGHRLGASAAGDEHRGRPGGGAPGTSVFATRGGLTGVWASALTGAECGRALRARHTWATTGERNVARLWSDSALQGDEVVCGDSVPLSYRLLGHVGWEHVALHDHRGAFWTRDLHRECGYAANRIRLRWGGARIRDRYRWAEWSGSIRVVGSAIVASSCYGFEHLEERAWRDGPDQVAFVSDTAGDADSITLVLSHPSPDVEVVIEATIGGFRKTGNADDRNPFATTPSVQWRLRLGEILEQGSLRRDLGGEELFLALERVTAEPLPLDLSGVVAVSGHPIIAGARPVFLHARELDDAKVWTSPIFLQPPGG